MPGILEFACYLELSTLPVSRAQLPALLLCFARLVLFETVGGRFCAESILTSAQPGLRACGTGAWRSACCAGRLWKQEVARRFSFVGPVEPFEAWSLEPWSWQTSQPGRTVLGVYVLAPCFSLGSPRVSLNGAVAPPTPRRLAQDPGPPQPTSARAWKKAAQHGAAAGATGKLGEAAVYWIWELGWFRRKGT